MVKNDKFDNFINGIVISTVIIGFGIVIFFGKFILGLAIAFFAFPLQLCLSYIQQKFNHKKEFVEIVCDDDDIFIPIKYDIPKNSYSNVFTGQIGDEPIIRITLNNVKSIWQPNLNEKKETIEFEKFYFFDTSTAVAMEFIKPLTFHQKAGPLMVDMPKLSRLYITLKDENTRNNIMKSVKQSAQFGQSK